MAKFLTVLTILAFLGLLCPGLATIPNPYYINTTWDDHTIHGIETLLGDGLTVPYQFGIFDCSERSAYVEWLLTCHGFDAGFCVDGSGPWAGGNPISQHMWVAVRLWNDTTGVYEGLVFIEASCDPMIIIRFADPEWSDYHRDQSNDLLGMRNYRSLPDLLAGITPNPGDDNKIPMGEEEVDWWQFGTDLVKKPVYKGINFKTTTPRKTNAGRTFRTN